MIPIDFTHPTGRRIKRGRLSATFGCQGCGAVRSVTEASGETLVALSGGFRAEHKRCAARKAAANG